MLWYWTLKWLREGPCNDGRFWKNCHHGSKCPEKTGMGFFGLTLVQNRLSFLVWRGGGWRLGGLTLAWLLHFAFSVLHFCRHTGLGLFTFCTPSWGLIGSSACLLCADWWKLGILIHGRARDGGKKLIMKGTVRTHNERGTNIFTLLVYICFYLFGWHERTLRAAQGGLMIL